MYYTFMTNVEQKTIDMASLIAPVIHSRDAIELVREAIQKTDAKSVVLDFSKVDFISRSAAHELLVLKENLKQTKHIDITFANTNKDINEMLRIVAANRAIPKHQVVPMLHVERTTLQALL